MTTEASGRHDYDLFDPEYIADPATTRAHFRAERPVARSDGHGGSWLPTRCAGSNLARMELRVALEEWLAGIPEFELAGDVTWAGGQIRGPRSVPVTFPIRTSTETNNEEPLP